MPNFSNTITENKICTVFVSVDSLIVELAEINIKANRKTQQLTELCELLTFQESLFVHKYTVFPKKHVTTFSIRS